MLRLAESYDLANSADGGANEQSFRRIVSAIAKYWLCKRAPKHVAESLECLGGAGYVEESVMPRLLRESPLNSIWEGSGNVITLDVLRAVSKEEGVVEAIESELSTVRDGDDAFSRYAKAVIDDLNSVKLEVSRSKNNLDAVESGSRRLVERLAIALQAALVLKHSSAAVQEAFLSSRIEGDWGNCFGTLHSGIKFDGIVDGVIAR
jgi:putative acyl-CoA dehydrogenase